MPHKAYCMSICASGKATYKDVLRDPHNTIFFFFNIRIWYTIVYRYVTCFVGGVKTYTQRTILAFTHRVLFVVCITLSHNSNPKY